MLCSSSTVCQIFNDKQKKAVVIDEEENEIDIVDVTEETLSKYVCAEFSEQNMRRYKRVDIYWPVDILKVELEDFQWSDIYLTSVLELYSPEKWSQYELASFINS